MPTDTVTGVRIVVHLIPLIAFDPSVRFGLSQLVTPANLSQLIPMGMDYSGGFTPVHNYEGLVSHTPSSYTQVFRNGFVEAVSFFDAVPLGQPATALRGIYIENMVLTALTSRLLPLQWDMNVEMPMLIMLSVLGAQGYAVVPEGNAYLSLSTRRPIERDALIMQNTMVESYNADMLKAMKPIPEGGRLDARRADHVLRGRLRVPIHFLFSPRRD